MIIAIAGFGFSIQGEAVKASLSCKGISLARLHEPKEGSKEKRIRPIQTRFPAIKTTRSRAPSSTPEYEMIAD